MSEVGLVGLGGLIGCDGQSQAVRITRPSRQFFPKSITVLPIKLRTSTGFLSENVLASDDYLLATIAKKMNSTNPYAPPSTRAGSRPWPPIDLLATGIWLLIPIGLFLGRWKLLPVYQKFGLVLPSATKFLTLPFTPVLFSIASLFVVFVMFSIPYGIMRRRFSWLACIAGGLVGSVCLVSFLAPLFELWQGLK